MGKKKMKLPSLFKAGAGGLLAIPLCYNAKTLSFRVGDDMIKTVNSVFFDNDNGGDVLEAKTPESWFTNSSDTTSHSTDSDQDLDAESLEMVVRGVVRSERLFFDPGVTSSILEENDPKSKSKLDCDLKSKTEVGVGDDRHCGIYIPPIEEISVAVAMESEDPYGDFRRSMEEMVMNHGELAKDWESLESMLAWYLRMNGRKSHGVIVSAFIDLVSGLGARTSSALDSARYSTAVSSFPSSPVYSLSQGQTEIEEEEEEERRSC